MNIQIFGKAKCFDTKKAERYFKERRIRYQFVDILKYGMSRGELSSVRNAVGLDAMINTEDVDYPLIRYLASDSAKLDKLFEEPYLIKTPIVRNGKAPPSGIAPRCGKTGNKLANDNGEKHIAFPRYFAIFSQNVKFGLDKLETSNYNMSQEVKVV